MSLKTGVGAFCVAGAPFWFLVLIWERENSRRGCGNVGIAERFQGRWKTRETWFWFSSFSTARHFHNPLPAVQHGVLAGVKLAIVLGLLHPARRRSVAFRLGNAAQSLKRVPWLEIAGGLGQLLERSPRRLVVAVHPLLLAFSVALDFGLSAGPVEVGIEVLLVEALDAPRVRRRDVRISHVFADHRAVFRFHQAVVGVPRTRLGLFDQQLVQ